MLANFPLFCPKCKEESLIDAEKFIVKESTVYKGLHRVGI